MAPNLIGDDAVFRDLRLGLSSILFTDQCVGCEIPLHLKDRWVDSMAAGSAAARRSVGSLVFVDHRHRWCRGCWQRLGLQQKQQCGFCGAEIRAANPLGDGCPLCQQAKLRFDRAVCLGNYAGLLRDLVIRMKNQKQDHMAVRLGELLAAKVCQQHWWPRIDFVVPVPTHWRRRLSRGFCAAEILADKVANDIDGPVVRQLAFVAKAVEKQGRLSIAKRRKNMRNVFAVDSRVELADKIVLIVDDVMTSGATVSELSKKLKQARAAAVFVAVVARGAGVS